MGIFGKKKPADLLDLSGDWIMKDMPCLGCGRPMRVVLGYGREGILPISPAMMDAMDTGYIKGSFRCRKCGGCYCWDCSDSERVCRCGHDARGYWQEVWYLEP